MSQHTAEACYKLRNLSHLISAFSLGICFTFHEAVSDPLSQGHEPLSICISTHTEHKQLCKKVGVCVNTAGLLILQSCNFIATTDCVYVFHSVGILDMGLYIVAI